MRTFLVSSILALTSTFAHGAVATDAEVLQVVHTANAGEIAAGKLAQGKAVNGDVKAFAESMVQEHTAMDTDGANLATKLKIGLKESDTSKTLAASADKEAAELKAATGADFDKKYVDAQVKDHETVLATIDNELLPHATNAEVKALLQGARPKVQQHLDHAKQLQATLKSSH